jgi:hypothetical protein
MMLSEAETFSLLARALSWRSILALSGHDETVTAAGSSL